MRVLVACEYSGRVREAFRKLGHDAWSCDLLPAEDEGKHHIQSDVLSFLTGMEEPWDLMIAHPPCTHLAVSGARHFAEKAADGRQQEALEFVRQLLDAPIPRICLENQVSIISSRISTAKTTMTTTDIRADSASLMIASLSGASLRMPLLGLWPLAR